MTLRSVLVIGAGKVGRALHAGLSAAGVDSSLRQARTLLARPLPLCDLVVISSRDGRIEEIARLLAHGERLPRAVVHCAGALDVTPLAALSARGVAVATMHPCLSFPSEDARVSLAGGALVATGDARAVALVKALARALGMNAIRPRSLDHAAYHAACALVANGSAALAHASARLLEAAGIAPRDAQRALGPLLVSVGHNVTTLSASEALSGPVARGDIATVRAHEAAIARHLPELLPLYQAMVGAQQAVVARRTARREPGVAMPEGPPRRPERPSKKPLRGPKNMRKRRVKAP
jgi:predicted short-subunit dehydrogenase-like oxidoreductase (DUF2520 family)